MTDIIFRSDMGVDLIDVMGSDAAIAQAARVSTGTESAGVQADAGLISYLMKNRHGSPFEHAVFTFRVECPIVVAREFMRHRMASYNETSGRYRELEPVFYRPEKSRPLQQVGKAGEYTFEEGTGDQKARVWNDFNHASQLSWDRYQLMLNSGVAREVARMVLPLNLYTSFYVTMNARGLMNFLSLRVQSDEATFKSFPMQEIHDVAVQMEDRFSELLPATHGAFLKNGRVCP